MSSKIVRDTIKAYYAAEAPGSEIPLVDLDGGYEDIHSLLQEAGVADSYTPWVGIQFIGNDEIPVTVAAVPGQGKFRETGAFFIHVVEVASSTVRDSIVSRAEALRTLFRGKNISGVRIQSVTPINFELGATLEFESGFIAGSFIADYEYDLDI